MTRSLRLPLGALLLLPALTWAQAQPTYFVQLSDPQFGMYTENKDFVQETANLEFVVANINRLHPAFVAITGDLINLAGDAAQLAEYKRITAKLASGIALYSVPGNHDVGNTPTPESLAAYRKNVGKDYYSFRSGNLEGIVLNSSIIQHPDSAPGEEQSQQKWLEAELAKAKTGGVTVIVFQHIPFFLTVPDEADQYFNIPLAIRARYLELLKRSGVRYIFAGHLHNNSFGQDGPLQMITSGPVGKPLGTGSASGMRIARVDSSGLQQAFFDLAHIPNQLTQAFEPAK